jgi:hypothetical protein
MDRPMGNVGMGGTSATDSGSSGFGSGTGSSSGSMGTGLGTSSGTGNCAHCGQSLSKGTGSGAGLEQFLGKLGISDDMISNLRTSMQNVDVEEYLNTARDYLRNGSEKATSYTKENPGKVAAGVAVLAVGAGLLISALNRD